MLHSVSILLLLLFSLNFSHDFKMLVLAEDELQNSSTLDCDGEPSCYRKGNPYKSNGSTVGSEIQTSRQLLMADLDRAASHGVLSPSISYSQSRLLPSTAILSPAQNMLNNSKLASSANISASVVESPSISSGNLRSKVSNGPLLCTIKTPQFCSLSPPSLAVQPSVHPSTHKQNFANLVLDHVPHLGIPNFSVPQGVTSRSLIPCAHVHNVLSFVSPYRSFHQEANHNGAPYVLIPPCSLTTGNMKHIEAASLPYYSVRSGPSFSLTQDRQSQESLRFGKYTHSVPLSRALPVTAPSLLTMHYGQPQDPSSPRVQAPENQPSVRFLTPSNDWPVQTLPPIASDGEKAQGLFVNENQPPKALPPMLASPGSPTVTSPPLLSPHDHQYQMHPSAFHPVMPNPSTYTEWLSPRVFGTPSQMRPPVEHSWTSVSPSGTVSSPTSLPSELSEPPEAAPSIIFPSHGHHHNMRGSVASSPSIFSSEPPQKKPSIPFAAWPRNIPKGQAPLALAPRVQEHVIPPISLPSRSPMEYPGRPSSAPFIAFHSPQYHQDENVQGPVASSPSIFPSVPHQKRPIIPVAPQPMNRSKRQTPVAVAPKNQEPVIPSISVPSNPPVEYPGTPEAAPSIGFHSSPHNRNVKGPSASPPRLSPSISHRQKSIIPVPNQPGKRSGRYSPAATAPIIQGPVSSPLITSPPEQPKSRTIFAPSIVFPPAAHYPRVKGTVSSPTSLPSELSKPPEAAPSIIFPSHGHHHNMRGSVASSPSIFPSEPPQKKPSTPFTSWPRHIPKGQAPLVLAPRIQEHVIPPISLPSRSPMEYPGRPASAPSIAFHSPQYHRDENVQGPGASSPSIFPSRPPQKKASRPFASWPRNIPKGQAPLALAPRIQEHVIPPISLPSRSPMEYPGRPASAPSIAFHSPQYHRDENVQGPGTSSPSIFPSTPHQMKPSIPVAPQPMNRSKRQTPVALAPKNQEPVIPSISVPSNPPVEYPGTPEADTSIGFHSPPHNQNVKGPSASPPRLSPSISHRQKSIIPVPYQPGKRSRRHSPAATAPIIQGPVSSPTIIPPSKEPNSRTIFAPSIVFPPASHYPRVKGTVSSPTSLPSELSKSPEAAPSIIFPSHGHHHNMRGSVASTPSIFPSEPPQKKPNTPFSAWPRNIPKGKAPLALAPRIQEHVIPPMSLPSRSPVEYPGRSALAPSIAFHSPQYHRDKNEQGPAASSPSIFPSVPHQKKPSIPVAPRALNRSKRQTPVALAPKNQEPVTPSISVPSKPPVEYQGTPAAAPSIRSHSTSHNQNVKGPAFPPRISPPISHRQKSIIPVPNQPGKKSWRHSPATTAPFIQGPVSSPSITPPPEQPNSRTIFAPSIVFPPPSHYPRVRGHLKPPGNTPSEPPQKQLRIPVASPPRIRSWWHAPAGMPPTNQGHFSSPPLAFPPEHYRRHSGILPFPPSTAFAPPPYHRSMEGPVAVPTSFASSKSPAKMPYVPWAAPPSKRSWGHAPTVIPPINQGPISSPIAIPFEPPKDNLRHPAPAPSRISPIPHHYWGMEGPVASTPSMIPSAPAQKKPNEPVAAPPSKRSSKHAPVASPPMVEGPVYSPVNHPLLSPSGNLRPPAVSPSVRFPSPPHHRHVKGPSASPAPASSRISPTHHYWGMKGPVASTPTMIPSAPAQEKPSTPMAAPPSKTSLKHAPVASPPIVEGPAYSPVNHPLLSPSGNLRSPTVSPSIGSFPPQHRHAKGPSASSARITPSEPPQMTRGIPLAAPPLVFPPPPPSQDCNSISCTQPFTSTPPGAPCGCVYPMQVELELGVALYAFFPLVSELAAEIAAGTFLKQSQVRIMGANADSQDQEKTIVILDLVPLGEKFDNTTAFLIFERFWQKKVIINGTLFGSYWVIFVSYPGLPPPPPSAFSNANIDGEPTNSSGPSKHEPLGVDINKRSKKMGTGIIAVVALSSAIGAVICVGAVWIILLKCKNRSRPSSAVVEPTSVSSVTKRSGGCGGSILSGSMASSTSMSFASSMAPYTGSAKTITLAELERATDRFNLQNVLGEGGFGRVYRGVLEDGTKVAVKVLTRDDQQGGREFIAEVEMLSRLHHRNLVKLIGICTEEHNRSLVYELIPNGSVESHLHGLDKETAPLDWDARIKIALGAARGLAYLHEDSSPRVIHRDFKASNILLEEDFTPKVSDFGLAKSASEEVSGHISTRVMGTFGYVAPEYAMTGHLLVKSDVYSYGVVLLELLTGRKPVDMSQPPGQENLVTWARPLLTSKEGLEALVDPALGSNLPFDNIARVAAIASMCVQPEVSHRPFMGEVVQALKLVYNDSDASNGGGSGSFSQGGESYVHDTEVKDGSSQQWAPSIQYIPDGSSFVTIDYDSGPLQTQGLVTERPLSASALLSTSGSLMRQLSGSFRRHSNSGPLRTNKSKKSSYGGVRGLAGGSISEHGVKRHEDVHELWP